MITGRPKSVSEENETEKDTPQTDLVAPVSDKERLRLAYVRLALLRRLADKVAPITAAEKRVVMELTDPGSTAKPTVDPADRQDRVPFVTVSHAYGRQSLTYLDAEFVPWVLREYPSEVTATLTVDIADLTEWAAGNESSVHGIDDIVECLPFWLHDTGACTDDVTLAVRESFKTRLGDLFKEHGRVVGPRGELDIPGVSVREGNPYVMVSNPNEDRLAELWAASIRTEIPAMLEGGTP